MIQANSTNRETLKQIKEREKKEKALAHRNKCEAIAVEKFGESQVVSWSNANKGLWYLSVGAEEDDIETIALMRPIDRHILSYASTKIEDGGLYEFLEAAMRECWVASIEADGSLITDKEKPSLILDDEECFIAAANKFNKILETKKASMVKR